MRLRLALCFCSIGRQGVHAYGQVDSSVPCRYQVPRVRPGTVQYNHIADMPRTPSDPPRRCFVVRCTFCRAEGGRLTDLSNLAVRLPHYQIGAPRRGIESRALHRQTRTPRTGASVLCERGALGLLSPCPPHAPQAWPGRAWGRASPGCQAPGAEVSSYFIS